MVQLHRTKATRATAPARATRAPIVPYPDRISGAFGRSTWAARFAEITDGTSNVIGMGEIRGWCSGFQYTNGWALPEGLWFATTAPINMPTCPGENGVPRIPGTGGSGCQSTQNAWNATMGFKSLHPGGANVRALRRLRPVPAAKH